VDYTVNPLISPPLFMLKKSLGYSIYPHIEMQRADNRAPFLIDLFAIRLFQSFLSITPFPGIGFRVHMSVVLL